MVSFELNGEPADVDEDFGSLLEALRDSLGVRSAKDGCSPQGQCGCCTVWIDGAPRVACVTPIERVAGRAVTTIEGLGDASSWAEAFCATGASQCGFCTPGIVMRLAALSPADQRNRASIERALLAHLCRCTGWTSIVEATLDRVTAVPAPTAPIRDLPAAERRATLEGGVAQRVHPDVVLGGGGFSDDLAPADSLVAMRSDKGTWSVAPTVAAARRAAGKISGRRTSTRVTWPIAVPEPEDVVGTWTRTLQTTWVEPAYLEPDAAWCAPGGTPSSPLGNGGAFGGKTGSEIGEVARRLADDHGRPVRALLTREDIVRLGPKRPPLSVAVAGDGHGLARLARPARRHDESLLRASIGHVAPSVIVEFVDVTGPSVSAALRASGWAEVAAVISSLGDAPDHVRAPNGSTATAQWQGELLVVDVACGEVLDEVVLRSYCRGAAHMALGLVGTEGLVVGDDGIPLDLTIRSFGVLRATDMPNVEIRIVPGGGPPVNGSDAVFAAVAAAAWRRAGFPARWPTSA